MTAQMKAYSQEIFTETQIRYFRLCAHHLDRWHTEAAPQALVGACGMVNTPPGVWETALFNRWHGCSLQDCRQLLYDEKRLLQAWSLRGAPAIFPTDESATFLNGLLPSAKTDQAQFLAYNARPKTNNYGKHLRPLPGVCGIPIKAAASPVSV